jgi:hypothetical protein
MDYVPSVLDGVGSDGAVRHVHGADMKLLAPVVLQQHGQSLGLVIVHYNITQRSSMLARVRPFMGSTSWMMGFQQSYVMQAELASAPRQI